MNKKVYLKSWGCQMNVRDSEMVMGLFLEKGYAKADSSDKADVVLFNTCSVRKHAEERAISNMGALLKRKAQSAKRKTYGMIGCTAQALKEDLFKRLPGLNLVCGTGEIHKLAELIDEAGQNQVLACGNLDGPSPEIMPHYREDKKHAYVLISRGCDNFCSYCVVPYVRGKERSRKVEDIVQEIEDLVGQGIKEVTLLGQNVNSYRSATVNFVQLLKIINDIKGVEKIRFMTSHPKDATLDLFRAIRDLGRVVKHLHLPLQSGSGRILKLMNRGYSAKKYFGLIKQLRNLVPRCRITTDVIVGFPSETESDFRKTMHLMQAIRFDAAYIFKYSPRPPAKSAQLQDDVLKEIKEKRHNVLLELQKKISKMKKVVNIILVILLLAFAGQGDLLAQSSTLRNVETLMLQANYTQAAKECERILAGSAQKNLKAKVYYLQGVCLLKEARYDEARKKFALLLEKYPHSDFGDDASLGIADSYYLGADFHQASQKYDEFIAKFAQSELLAIAQEHRALCKQGKQFANSYFSLQMGCFASKTNAEKMRDELIEQGYQAYILELPGESLYRVRIGKFSTKPEAEVLEQRLKAEGFSTKVCP